MRGNLKTLLVLFLILMCLSATTVVAAAGPAGDERLILDLLNAERKEAGVRPLKWGGRIARIARNHSQDMVSAHYFSHTSPTAGAFTDRLRSGGLKGWRSAGENLAGAPSAEAAFEVWLQSLPHRKNMLKPNYERVGIGIAEGGPYGAMFTMNLVEKPVGSMKAQKLSAKRLAKRRARARAHRL